eukprot:1160355-Pelagomonas_calceolata.AAC.2
MRLWTWIRTPPALPSAMCACVLVCTYRCCFSVRLWTWTRRPPALPSAETTSLIKRRLGTPLDKSASKRCASEVLKLVASCHAYAARSNSVHFVIEPFLLAVKVGAGYSVCEHLV